MVCLVQKGYKYYAMKHIWYKEKVIVEWSYFWIGQKVFFTVFTILLVNYKCKSVGIDFEKLNKREIPQIYSISINTYL